MILQELGYKDIEVEKEVLHTNVDIYIGDIDMAINIHGPPHYKNNTNELIGSCRYMRRMIEN